MTITLILTSLTYIATIYLAWRHTKSLAAANKALAVKVEEVLDLLDSANFQIALKELEIRAMRQSLNDLGEQYADKMGIQ